MPASSGNSKAAKKRERRKQQWEDGPMLELNDEPVRSARASNHPLSAPLGPALALAAH